MATKSFISRNNFEVSGRLTADAQMHDAKNGKVARFSIAHNYGKGMDPLYVDAVMFSKNGKKDVTIPTESLTKGQAVIASGYLRPNNYKSEAGQTIRRIDFVVLSLEPIKADPEDEAAAEQAPAEEAEA